MTDKEEEAEEDGMGRGIGKRERMMWKLRWKGKIKGKTNKQVMGNEEWVEQEEGMMRHRREDGM